MVLDTYGRSTGFCIDPIEKKPLNHFLPGTPVLSFGTAGCNLGCKFCQNWDISKSREVSRLSDNAWPHDIAAAAKQSGCRSVAFTYNDPVIWAEYALDVATACRSLGIQMVAVTAGYITEEARGEFFDGMDAANIDLKAFTEDFYFKLTGAHLDSVLDTVKYVVNETNCWVELTNLIIPEANDNPDEVKRMCDWILDSVGAEVPVHFTAFHPDFRMMDRPRTSHETLIQAYDIARESGLHYVYVGNVHDGARQSTYCPSCKQLLIERDWHQLGRYAMNHDQCGHCHHKIAGHFEKEPGSWGQRRQPIRINSTAEPPRNQLKLSTKNATMNVFSASSNSDIEFSNDELKIIHAAACQAVTATVLHQASNLSKTLGDLEQRSIAGVYVTLKRGETLRGCCGMHGPPFPLGQGLANSSSRTAKDDPRMAPIAAVELPHLDLSISILGPPRPIEAKGDDRIDAVQVGKHGLRIRMGKQVGLLLPVVATERKWDSRQFLDAVCTKAELPPGTWRSDQAVVEIFDGVYYGAPFLANETTVPDRSLLAPEQLARLTTWVENNLAAVCSGATPFYYANGVEDATVSGVVLQVTFDPQKPPASWMQLNIREGVPLQSTLYQLTQNAAQSLKASGYTNADSWKPIVAGLSTPVHHGTGDSAELAGLSVESRSLIAMDGRRWAIEFDQAADPSDLLKQALAAQRFRAGATQIYSVVCDSSAPQFSVSMSPQANPRTSARPPAVVGTFYPADDHQREQTVDGFIADSGDVQPASVSAAMVPHAGLRFSGKVATDVWRRIELPETVLIIGPKHTSDGVDWAVAPHDLWHLSATALMKGNMELAQKIADSVPGMELDSGAHRREHCIEVQLPLLHRLSPQTRITAIAMSGGMLEEIRAAAKALAGCLAELEQPPLMIISSDLNHFADDTENRRRDRLALEMLEKDDPEGLMKICQEQNISMCGQIPAALVLLTLQELKQKAKYQEIAYATSGDVSGDLSRVVGYAGVLF